ncbi:MAG: hypothetical protein PHY47_07425 [Lachnospiraceae bacterium]|nr:hypothetical protein [Lachnospiraceae bacterium]
MKKGTVAILSTMVGAIIGAATTGTVTGKIIDNKADKVDKFKGYYNMLNQWLLLKQEGKSLVDYFESNNYKTIAIYGMGEMGNRLYDELRDSNIEVRCGIDKESSSVYSELEVISIEDELPEVDAIIVSAVFAFNEISEKLGNIVDYPIISLEDVVYVV